MTSSSATRAKSPRTLQDLLNGEDAESTQYGDNVAVASAGSSNLSSIADQLNSQREQENASRLDGATDDQIRQDIDRFAGDRYQEVKSATSGSAPGITNTSNSPAGEVAATEGSQTRLGLETVDPGAFQSGRTGNAVTSTGTDEYYSALYPRYQREDTVMGYGANFPGAQVGGSNPYKETTTEYLGTPLPPVNNTPASPGGGSGGGGGGGGGNIKPPQKPEEQFLERTLRSFIGDNPGEGDAIGARGIGEYMGYYGDRYGGSQEILDKAVEEGIKFGPTAAKTLGINTDTKSAQGGDFTEGAIGLAAVDRLRGRGLSDTAIKQFAQEQGLQYGAEALKSLGADASFAYQAPAAAPTPTPAAPAPSRAAQDISTVYQKPAYNSGGSAIGAAGLERMAAARGISFAQARSQAQSAGMRIGAAAQAR
tara:strand:- start:2038 stop:3309 length:1272 start_codon:yes stop_codon:yes gene_type:complete